MMGLSIAFKVADASYVTDHTAEGLPYDALRVTFENGKCIHVPNYDFSLDNPALHVLTFLGARPSRLEAAEGQMLPIRVDPEMGYVPADTVFVRGRKLLECTAWGPDEGAAPN